VGVPKVKALGISRLQGGHYSRIGQSAVCCSRVLNEKEKGKKWSRWFKHKIKEEVGLKCGLGLEQKKETRAAAFD
jgi:hypothetical protein